MLVTVIAGLSSEARLSTVIIRALIVFVLSGGILFLVFFLLQKYEELYHRPRWLSKAKDIVTGKGKERKTAPQPKKKNEDAEDTAVQAQEEASPEAEETPAEGTNLEEEGGDGFQPLSPGDLERVSAP